MNQNTNINEGHIPEVTPEKAPPVMASVLIAVLCAVLAPFSSTLILAPLFGAGVTFLFSAKVNVAVRSIPVMGVALSYLFGGIWACAIAAVLWLCAAVCGTIIRLGGDFHRALMGQTFSLLLIAVAGAAAIMYLYAITVKDIAAFVEGIFAESMSQVLQMYGQALPAETLDAMATDYAEFARLAVLYLPATAGMAAVVYGIISLLICGWFHNVTGTGSYTRRDPVVDPVFAVIWIVSLFIGAFDGGIAGVVCSNIMMIFLLPCSAAGITSYKAEFRLRRKLGLRGIPFSLILLIAVSVLFSPLSGIMILAINGAFFAFRKKHVLIIKK